MDERGPAPPNRKPRWLARRLAVTHRFCEVEAALNEGGLHTVCKEARCPNRTECWSEGTATFLLLGDRCTRGCAFCAVTRATTGVAPDPGEPDRVSRAAVRMGLAHVVLTSVTRDDLPDGGAAHYARTIERLRETIDGVTVEVLVPDYLGAPLDLLREAAPEVFAHNVEVVERLTPRLRHPRFSYRRSLAVLSEAARGAAALRTKSSLQLGVGEEVEEVRRTLRDLREAGVQSLALGQYLRPTPQNAPVARYVAPEEFSTWREEALAMGFAHVTAGPFVRTSYRAREGLKRLGTR